ncbi:glycosyltransferase family 2 protein [Tabrizicola caldifontis]|uniref:glycosyltransferase family 2 protein n=1 Tax=Tabrizicola caldifontis TaxID=2528036 RepID=UPI00107FEE93|nr:glycosyltransferase family 2 protein [Rhodobacter sp. YIM 73028]
MSEAGHAQFAQHRAQTVPEATGEPLISVIMANLNGEPHLERAIRSVLDQTHRNLELVISDDGSGDCSLRLIRDAMANDPRVRLLESDRPTGPAAARNRALNAALGDWIAIFDSDDMIHPQRLQRLLAAAVDLGADIVADDLVFFGEDPGEQPGTLLQDLDLRGPQEIDALALVSGNLAGASDLSLGYLKPLIRRGAMGQIRYNEALRIDEDYDLYLHLLMAGARFFVIPEAMYLYRRHAQSTSHRISAFSLERMVQAQSEFLDGLPPDKADLSRAVSLRMRDHVRELGYVRVIDAIRTRRWFAATAGLLGSPRNMAFLIRSLGERLQRRRLRQNAARTRINLLLCRQGQDVPAEYSGFTRFEVPDVCGPASGPSAARIWARLASLACRNDLAIVALDEAGEFALGLVPRHVGAEVRRTAAAKAGLSGQGAPVSADTAAVAHPEEA